MCLTAPPPPKSKNYLHTPAFLLPTASKYKIWKLGTLGVNIDALVPLRIEHRQEGHIVTQDPKGVLSASKKTQNISSNTKLEMIKE